MTQMYFTFGTDPRYPYGIEDYIIAIGTDTSDCIATFKKKYPNCPGSDAINCADYYTVEEWNKITEQHYKGIKPKEVLVSDTVYGCKPEGFDDFWMYVPSYNEIVYVQEGCGDNLLPEDTKEGIVDYLETTAFFLGEAEVQEDDGGELMTPYMVQEHYGCLADAIPDVLDFLYGDMFLEARILNKKGDD